MVYRGFGIIPKFMGPILLHFVHHRMPSQIPTSPRARSFPIHKEQETAVVLVPPNFVSILNQIGAGFHQGTRSPSSKA